MTDPTLIILYVDQPAVSASFYADLLQRPPLESSPTFAMLALAGGNCLGLWSRHTVEPAAAAGGGGCELAFAVDGPERVDIVHADWKGRGVTILQAPLVMDFGYTFTAIDPDGHRLRVFSPAGQ